MTQRRSFAAAVLFSVAVLTVALASGCGAGHKIEDGGERIDNTLGRELKSGKKEVHDTFTDDAGVDATVLDAH